MTIITEKEVTKIARLSRIEVSDATKPELASKLGKILDWMENLKEVDTTNIVPLSNVHKMSLLLAKDEVSDDSLSDKVLKNAPDTKYNYFTVPKMIE